jgi:hypothetical protein
MRLFKLALIAGISAVGVTSTFAENRDFMLKNNSSFVVTEFYASPSNVSSWEEDILGADVLGSGEAVNITIADGRKHCEYDLRIVFDDGDIVEDTTDLCETGSYTVTD